MRATTHNHWIISSEVIRNPRTWGLYTEVTAVCVDQPLPRTNLTFTLTTAGDNEDLAITLLCDKLDRISRPPFIYKEADHHEHAA